MKQDLDGNENGIIEIEKSVKKSECNDISKLKRKEYNKIYYNRHRQQCLKKCKEYNNKNKEFINEYKRTWHDENYKNYYEKNKLKIRKNKLNYYYKTRMQRKEKVKSYRLKNIDKIKSESKIYNKNYRMKNKDKFFKYYKSYYIKNKNEHNLYSKIYNSKRYKSDPIFKLSIVCRSRIRQILKLGYYKTKHTIELVGCSWNNLKLNIEKQFKPGMSWINYGKLGWHIDHIIPLSSAKSQKEMEKLCHYTNLQPLWWYENLRKGNRI